MKKLLIFVGSALALTALYISTNLNGKKKDKIKQIDIDEININDFN